MGPQISAQQRRGQPSATRYESYNQASCEMIIIAPLRLKHPETREMKLDREMGLPTNDDVVERLLGYLVDCSEHEMNEMKVRVNKQLFIIRRPGGILLVGYESGDLRCLFICGPHGYDTSD